MTVPDSHSPNTNMNTVSPSLPPDCPYALRKLCSDGVTDLHVLREHDEYGEYPNIYIQIIWPSEEVLRTETTLPRCVILSDVGTGLDKPALNQPEDISEGYEHVETPTLAEEPTAKRMWNIATVLERAINPEHKAPYFILQTHFHYDHILGIKHLQADSRANITVIGSSLGKTFYSPWKTLQKNSLCGKLGLQAPRYTNPIVSIDDMQSLSDILGTHRPGFEALANTICLHTPGHTPDSMTWYNSDLRLICVGDMFYEASSEDSSTGSHGRWEPEGSAPVVFVEESNLATWRQSMQKVLDFVRQRNKELVSDDSKDLSRLDPAEYIPSDLDEEAWILPGRTRVKLCAAHVTVTTDAEGAILDMLAFMDRILKGKVGRRVVDNPYQNVKIYRWEEKRDSSDPSRGRYTVQAPHKILFPSSTRGLLR